MNLSALTRLLRIADPCAIRPDGSLYIEGAYSVAQHYGLDTKGYDGCDCYVDCGKKMIKFHLFDENYHNGSYYNNRNHEFTLTSEAVDLLIKRISATAIDVLERKLREEHENRFRREAEKRVLEMIVQQE